MVNPTIVIVFGLSFIVTLVFLGSIIYDFIIYMLSILQHHVCIDIREFFSKVVSVFIMVSLLCIPIKCFEKVKNIDSKIVEFIFFISFIFMTYNIKSITRLKIVKSFTKSYSFFAVTLTYLLILSLITYLYYSI